MLNFNKKLLQLKKNCLILQNLTFGTYEVYTCIHYKYIKKRKKKEKNHKTKLSTKNERDLWKKDS